MEAETKNQIKRGKNLTELAVFERGGWLAVGCRLNISPDIIKRRCLSPTSLADLRRLYAMVTSLPILRNDRC